LLDSICLSAGVLEIDSQIALDKDDLSAALYGFTPASIRNVPLHAAGDVGWDDIGGLTDIKATLMETLQWPAKVCNYLYRGM